MVSLILNPRAGKGKAKKYADDATRFLKEHNVNFEIYETEYPGHATKITEEIIKHAPEKIVVLGGDGTINEVVQALAETEIPLLPLPLGTGNDFVKYLYPRKKYDTILEEKIHSRKTIKVDVALLEHEKGKRYFINGMGIGFDAEVLNNMKKIKLLKGDFLYTTATILTFFKFKGLKLKVKFKKLRKTFEDKFLLFNVGNGQYLGGGFRLFPLARMTDHLLDISMIKPVGVLDFFRNLFKAFKGTHIYAKQVTYLQDREIHIESEVPFVVQVDGELVENLRKIKLKVVPSALRVVI